MHSFLCFEMLFLLRLTLRPERIKTVPGFDLRETKISFYFCTHKANTTDFMRKVYERLSEHFFHELDLIETGEFSENKTFFGDFRKTAGENVSETGGIAASELKTKENIIAQFCFNDLLKKKKMSFNKEEDSNLTVFFFAGNEEVDHLPLLKSLTRRGILPFMVDSEQASSGFGPECMRIAYMLRRIFYFVKNPLKCTDVPETANADLSSLDKCRNTFLHHSCRFKCEKGYFAPRGEIYCDLKGRWKLNKNESLCVEETETTHCSESLNHGRISKNCSRRAGQECDYDCENRYHKTVSNAVCTRASKATNTESDTTGVDYDLFSDKEVLDWSPQPLCRPNSFFTPRVGKYLLAGGKKCAAKVAHGLIEKKCDFGIGSLCRIQCSEGYSLNRSSKLKCVEVGDHAEWFGPAECNQMKCSNRNFQNFVAKGCDFKLGSACDYDCKPGLIKVASFVKCVSSRREAIWENKILCENQSEFINDDEKTTNKRVLEIEKCSHLKCSKTPFIKNAEVPRRCAGKGVGELCRVRCKDKHVKSGLDPVCQENDTWGIEHTKCISIKVVLLMCLLPLTGLVLLISSLCVFFKVWKS